MSRIAAALNAVDSRDVMSLKVTGVYFSASSAGPGPGKMKATIRASRPSGPSRLFHSPTSPASPTQANNVHNTHSQSLDYLHLNFEEKRQIIASSLSLVDFLHPPKAAGTHPPPVQVDGAPNVFHLSSTRVENAIASSLTAHPASPVSHT